MAARSASEIFDATSQADGPRKGRQPEAVLVRADLDQLLGYVPLVGASRRRATSDREQPAALCLSCFTHLPVSGYCDSRA